jgi:hypothetical protein
MGFLDTILIALGLKKPAEDTSSNDSSGSAGSYSPSSSAPTRADEPEEEEEQEDDDGEGRDYNLEARDDRASFDFDNNLDGYFEGKMRIEYAWEDTDKRAGLFDKYRIRNVQHWYQVTATFERWSESPACRAKFPTPGDLMQAQMNSTQRISMELLNIGNQQGALAADLEPVEGISLAQWAKAQAQIANGGNYEEIIASNKVDRATWDRVSAEWNARMSRDTSATIAMEYGKAFQNSGVGQFAGAAAASYTAGQTEADAPIPFERYVEIECAQSAASKQGKDAAALLKSFGLSPMDWGAVGGWWSMYIGQNAMRNNGELHTRYTQLQAKFDAKYATASADDDISF